MENIIELNKLRYELIHKKNAAWNEETEKYDYDTSEDDKKIDEYAAEICKLLKENFENLKFEFILEQLANLGDAPSVLYDDNGNWAISGDGFASVSLEIADWEGTFFVEKECWKETPREALRYYLFNDDEE
jgi:hypothetical protein